MTFMPIAPPQGMAKATRTAVPKPALCKPGQSGEACHSGGAGGSRGSQAPWQRVYFQAQQRKAGSQHDHAHATRVNVMK